MLSRRLAIASLIALVAGCGPAPLPAPRAVTAGVSATPAALQPPLPARWVESGGATLIGPVVAGGTLVLLGGRRALVRADGSLETEKVAAPEPLAELVLIPASTGTGARLVGRGVYGVYRFDDVLGAPVALARTEAHVVRLGAGPGVVAVWTAASDLPRFLDVETGHERPWKGLPDLPLRALSFVDDRRGAGIFEAAGLAVTTDAGATWRLVSETGPGDALRMNGLRRRGGTVRAFAFADGADGAVDVDGARLAALEPPRPSATEAPLLRWIRTTGRDPLEATASGGLDLPGGGALVASHGLLARVDPRSGAIPELVDIARARGASPCGAGRSGRTAWVACAVADEPGRDLFDPFGVVKVPLGEGALSTERPALVRNGEAELRVSPSGGAMLLAPCSHDETGSACVRQPDGTWKTIAVDGDLTERGAGPLADGRVAFLRGMFENDQPPEPAPEGAGSKAAAGAPSGPAAPIEDENARSRRLHVSVVGLDGKEHHLAPIGFTPARGYVRAQSPIEEDTDRSLHFVVEDGDGPFSVVAPPGKESPQAHRIPDAIAARLHAGHGIAVGEGRVLASLDGGVSWTEVPATPPVREAVSQAAASYEDAGQLAVSELGAKVGTMLRLGWGPSDAVTEPAPPSREAPLLATSRPSSPAPARVLTCASQGATASTAPLHDAGQVKQLLAGKPRPTPGTRHETASWSSTHPGMLTTVALLDEEGPEGGSAPARWTFRWQDPQEMGGRVRSASVPAPTGATWGSGLRLAAAAGARALFAVRSGTKLRLVRVSATGAVEVVEAPTDMVPAAPSEVAFGEGHREVIAWIRDTLVVAWLPGERPRAIARFGAHAGHNLGTPTAEGVPLLLTSSDWALVRTLPIPPLGKGPPPVAPPSLDGWTHFVPSRIDALPICTAKAVRPRFTMAAPSLLTEVDGAKSASAGTVLYTARVAGSEVCLASVTAAIGPERPGAKPPAPASAAAPLPPTTFVRADLASKRAEGGERGLPPAATRRMTCSLSTPK
jgi:hypothetical protein